MAWLAGVAMQPIIMLLLLLGVTATTSAASFATPSPLLQISSGSLTLSLDPNSLAYTISVGNVAWFTSGCDGGYSFSAEGKVASLAQGSLQKLGPVVRGNGSDAAGVFASLECSFGRHADPASASEVGPAQAEWIATFKAYEGRSALVFAQRWPQGVREAQGGSTFPSLRASSTAPRQLGTLEYTGASCGFMVGAQGEFPGITGGPDKGYIVIAPRDVTGTGAEDTLSIGPVTEHFANQARNSNNSLIYGLAPTFQSVPAGYELETVLVASSSAGPQRQGTRDPAWASVPSGGVNGALMEFGDFVLPRHNKTRAKGHIRPETQYIGYSTTAYYFCMSPLFPLACVLFGAGEL